MQRASKDNELGLFWEVVAVNVSQYIQQVRGVCSVS